MEIDAEITKSIVARERPLHDRQTVLQTHNKKVQKFPRIFLLSFLDIQFIVRLGNNYNEKRGTIET